MRMRSVTWTRVALVVALMSCSDRERAPATPPQPGLTPTATVVHYRYSTAPALDTDLSGMITQLEARVQGSPASPLDMTDLAELYHRRALQDGALEDYQRSETLARQSLEKMPTHNGAHPSGNKRSPRSTG